MICRPVCVSCRCEMRCSKNSKPVMREGDVSWQSGDEYTCPKCDLKVVVGFGRPIEQDKMTDEEKGILLTLPVE